MKRGWVDGNTLWLMSLYASAGLHCNEVKFSSASWYPSLPHPQDVIDCRLRSAHKALVETLPWFLTSTTTPVCETNIRRVETSRIANQTVMYPYSSQMKIDYIMTQTFSHYRDYQHMQNLESRWKLILVTNQPLSVLCLETSCDVTALTTLQNHGYGQNEPYFHH